MDQLRTEQVQKKKNEFHLIGEERRIKGHTLFCFNEVTKKIKVAPMNQDHRTGSVSLGRVQGLSVSVGDQKQRIIEKLEEELKRLKGE